MTGLQKLKHRLNITLFISAVYFILWGLLVLIFPELLRFILIKSNSTSMIFWDLISVVTLILGIALLIAAFDPFKHWLILLINLLFHLSIVIGFIVGYYDHIFSIDYLPFICFNHLPWMIPLVVGLIAAYHRNFHSDTALMEAFSDAYLPLEVFETTRGESLADISEETPALLVFLRQFGCPFCQETLMYLQRNRQYIERKGVRLVLVYMSLPQVAEGYLDRYGLTDVDQISDPESIIYKRFKLHRGKLLQLLGVKVIARWVWLAISKGIFFKGVEGDFYQMPGLILLYRGKIVKEYKYQSVADRPDYIQLLNYNG